MAPAGRGVVRTARVDGSAFAATAPTVESGRRRPNKVRNARFADVADWIPLELYGTEVAALRALGRHIHGRCRLTAWELRSARVLMLTENDDLALFGSSWSTFEDLNEPDSREIAEFVRCADALDGLVTRALVTPSVLHVVLTGDPWSVAVRGRAALHRTLPDPTTRAEQ